MASIHIERNHTLGLEGARRAVEEIATQMRSQLSLDYEWHGNVLQFHRPGANGRINVGETRVTVDVELGMMLGAFRHSVEGRIRHFLDQRFG